MEGGEGGGALIAKLYGCTRYTTAVMRYILNIHNTWFFLARQEDTIGSRHGLQMDENWAFAAP